MANVIRIHPYKYIHVLDTNSNVTRLETGPKIFVKQDHEKITSGKDPLEMIKIPPYHYVVIKDPVVVEAETGKPTFDKYGQVIVKTGDSEIRFHTDYSDPFPLYPREQLEKGVTPLQVVAQDHALWITCERDFADKEGNNRQPGDEWYFLGPGIYYPRIEERVVKEVESVLVKQNQALKLRARKECTDAAGKVRKAGEEWLIREAGAYLPGVFEEYIQTLDAYILTDRVAVSLRATRAFEDVYHVERKAGEEWLVESVRAPFHILDVYEEFVGTVNITILTKNQWCVVLDPVDLTTGKNKLGAKELKVGEDKFFVKPGERLEGGIQNTYVLAEDQALLIRAKEGFVDGEEERKPGDKWMIQGPCAYIPSLKEEVLTTRTAIPLHLHEGIYVRDTKTGAVRAEIGHSYMLKAHEELWEMPLNDVVEGLLFSGKRTDKTRVVTFKCPDNSVVQVYNYKNKKSRCVIGPDLVMLGPDEQFTLNVLSGGKPKRVGVIQTLQLMLGPDFSTDIIEVETSDHARLRLQLSYNWHFEVDRSDEESFQKVFSVRDFVGNICNLMAAKVRGAIASETFENFHKEYARIIRKSVFGLDAEGHVNERLNFSENSLVITNVDIQNVEPVDSKTQQSLQKSVTLAIEITTNAQEAKARHEAERQAQEALGQLQRQEIEDMARVEDAKIKLVELKNSNAGIQSEGEAIADAKAKAAAADIVGHATVEEANLQAKVLKVKKESELSRLRAKNTLELEHRRKMDALEIEKAEKLSEIESGKLKTYIDAIGQDTLVAIAEAGPAMQAEMLQGLGLSGYLMMDSNSPINLFSAAQGMINPAMMTPATPPSS